MQVLGTTFNLAHGSVVSRWVHNIIMIYCYKSPGVEYRQYYVLQILLTYKTIFPCPYKFYNAVVRKTSECLALDDKTEQRVSVYCL